MEKIRVGVIGYGYWGPNLVRNLNELPLAELVGVADLRQERLDQVKKTYSKVNVTQNYKDLFTQDLDAVVLATPPSSHFRIGKECIEHGLNVLVEKPITLTSQDARDLCEIAHQNDRILMVGHTFEYNAAVIALKKLIEQGELGDIYYVDTARLNLGLFQPELNAMWDLAPHDISILNFVLSMRPYSVNAMGKSSIIPNVQDVVYLTLFYPGGVLAHVHVSWLDPCKVRRVTVVGSKKMVVYNDIEAAEKIRIYDKGVETPHEITNYGDFQYSYRVGDIHIPNIRFTEPLKTECQHFLDCIQKHVQPSSCGEDGEAVVKVLEAAQRSLSNSGHQEEIQW